MLPQQPKDIVVIGAGAIGVEFAYFFNAFGTKVTISKCFRTFCRWKTRRFRWRWRSRSPSRDEIPDEHERRRRPR